MTSNAYAIDRSRVAIRTIESDVAAAPILLEFIGEAATRFSAGHPLHRGTQLLREPSRMQSIADLIALCEFEVASRSILAHLVGKGTDERTREDLRSAQRCRALLFEAIVLRELIEPYVDAARWRRYESATSDIVTTNPQLQVECTQLERYSIPLMIKRAENKLRQKRQEEGPYLVVVGTDVQRTSHILNDLTEAPTRKLGDWMGRHPEVAAFLITAPRAMSESDRIEQVDDEDVFHVSRYCALTFRNRKALDPLPEGFEMNWVRAS